MAFSRRLSWDQPANRLSLLIAGKRKAGAEILELTESNPTRAALVYPDGLLAPLADVRGLTYEPTPQGSKEARAAVGEYYRGLGVEVPIERVMLTASTSEAYSYLFQLLADPGDEILSPRPSYPLFEFLAGLSSVNIRQYPLRYDGSWHVDFEALETLITAKTRAIVVVNPNNPTGSFLKRDELERLDALAARHGVAIISDEVFCDYGFGSGENRAVTLAGERRALTFSMSGLSKVAGLPQLKLGWIVASGPGCGAAMEALELIADTYLSVATPVQVALPSLLGAGAAVREQISKRTEVNLACLRSSLAGSAGGVLNVEGGWYGVVQVTRTYSEEEWTLRLLEEVNVIVQPGFFFDFESEAYLVLSLLTPAERFAEGLRRMRAFL
ncbi:MAG: pyridoxal phosphate-dependent aminotransferase [Bryobacteraceae bacterium]